MCIIVRSKNGGSSLGLSLINKAAQELINYCNEKNGNPIVLNGIDSLEEFKVSGTSEQKRFLLFYGTLCDNALNWEGVQNSISDCIIYAIDTKGRSIGIPGERCIILTNSVYIGFERRCNCQILNLLGLFVKMKMLHI